MDAKTAERNLTALNHIRTLVVRLRHHEESLALKGDLDDLLLPVDTLRRVMRARLDVLPPTD